MNRNEKRSSPRRTNAAKQIAAYIHDSRGGYGCFYWGTTCRPDEFWWLMFKCKFEADKYDVLCALPAIYSCRHRSFIRGDIRHKDSASTFILLVITIIIILSI